MHIHKAGAQGVTGNQSMHCKACKAPGELRTTDLGLVNEGTNCEYLLIAADVLLGLRFQCACSAAASIAGNSPYFELMQGLCCLCKDHRCL